MHAIRKETDTNYKYKSLIWCLVFVYQAEQYPGKQKRAFSKQQNYKGTDFFTAAATKLF